MNFTRLIDIRQTPQYAAFIKSLGWQVINYKSSQIFIKKLPFFNLYVGKLLRTNQDLTLIEIKNIINKYHIIYFSHEPFIFEINDNGQVYYQINSQSIQLTPTKTLWINLNNTQQLLLSRLKAKTRYNLKRANLRMDYEIIESNEFHNNKIAEILSLWSLNKPYSWLFPAPKNEFISLLKYFRNKCFIVRCFEKHIPKTTLAFCLILCSPNIASYWHNGSSILGRQLFAPTLCIWQAMLESKRRKLTIFDFEGLYDERFPKKNISWKGFSRFKEGFFSACHRDPVKC